MLWNTIKAKNNNMHVITNIDLLLINIAMHMQLLTRLANIKTAEKANPVIFIKSPKEIVFLV